MKPTVPAHRHNGSGGPFWDGWLPATGDYSICVRILEETGRTDYTLYVSVTH